MKCQIPQISWHSRDPVLSVDFQVVRDDIRRLATGGTDTHVIIWYVTICPKNTITVECACDLNRHNKSVNVVRFSPDGEYLASGDDEGGIFIWKLREKSQPDPCEDENVGNREEWSPFKLLRGHLDDICDFCWSADSNYLMSGSIDNTVMFWDIQKGQSIQMSKDAKGFVQGVTWDPLNQYHASLSSDRLLRVYNNSGKRVLHRIHKVPWVETAEKASGKVSKLFHDDTLQSFCRRLTYSPDGELLFAPAGIREKDEKTIHTTYVFSRHDFSQPILHLPTGEKYTLAVRCCPMLFKLRIVKEGAEEKPMLSLPYRVLIAVATQDAIYLYDTQQLMPFAYISNIHYTHLTDLAWSSDGRILIISSTDGYCSFVTFAEGELGEIYDLEHHPDVRKKLFGQNDGSADTLKQKVADKQNKSELVSEEKKMEICKDEIQVQKDTCSDVNSMEVDCQSPKVTTPIRTIVKTPKRTPVSTKKTPGKITPITSFFSPPDKSKTSYIDAVEENINDQEQLHSKVPNVIVTQEDGVAVLPGEHKDVESQHVISNLKPATNTKPLTQSQKDKNSRRTLDMHISKLPKIIDYIDIADSPIKMQSSDKDLTVSVLHAISSDSAVIKKEILCTEDEIFPKDTLVSVISSDNFGIMQPTSEASSKCDLKETIQSNLVDEKSEVVTSSNTANPLSNVQDNDTAHTTEISVRDIEEQNNNSESTVRATISNQGLNQKPKKRVQLITLSNKVSSS